MAAGKAPSRENRIGLDYRAEASRFTRRSIVDIHTHIYGAQAARVYDEARRLYGVRLTYSMTQAALAPAVREALGDTVRFIAFPSWADPDKARIHRGGFLEAIETFHRDFGSRILKLWSSPRLRELVADGTDLWELDSPWRVKACELGQSLGMMFMVHVGDPDTWFSTKWSDAGRFGTKLHQYEGLERMLDRFTAPWIAAHMGGWPEDLAFLDGLLSRHPNLHLDTSATKWIVRELSRQPRERVRAFFVKWKGRVLFGSDIVTTDDHLVPRKSAGASIKAEQSDSPEGAFELYASRYWALRTLFETSHVGPSPIADPDLHMVEPARYAEDAAPELRGLALPEDVLAAMYGGAARDVVEAWERSHR